MDNINLAVVRETFGKVVYTHKTYEKAADICYCKAKIIKTLNIGFLTLTTGSAIGSLLRGEQFILFTSIISTISLFFVIYQFNFNFEGLAYEYKSIAKKLWLIREKYQNFIADILTERFSSNQITERRDLLLEELNEILIGAPSTDDKAYKKARKALKFEEEMTFNNQEIDKFLPENLQIK
jgi:hypothetical protein